MGFKEWLHNTFQFRFNNFCLAVDKQGGRKYNKAVRRGKPGRTVSGEVAEWTMATVLKTVERKLRGFESLPLRQMIYDFGFTIYGFVTPVA